jgi:hypothetical protein
MIKIPCKRCYPNGPKPWNPITIPPVEIKEKVEIKPQIQNEIDDFVVIK